tara:strand:- start:2 stop:220 length:219 start_codon:yes stop_codon:yes gene_type:complete
MKLGITPLNKIEREAKDFRKRLTPKQTKALTTRRYLAGQALSGILSRGRGIVNMHEVRREAYEWADFMLEYD